jgi:hypothetical protein
MATGQSIIDRLASDLMDAGIWSRVDKLAALGAAPLCRRDYFAVRCVALFGVDLPSGADANDGWGSVSVHVQFLCAFAFRRLSPSSGEGPGTPQEGQPPGLLRPRRDNERDLAR